MNKIRRRIFRFFVFFYRQGLKIPAVLCYLFNSTPKILASSLRRTFGECITTIFIYVSFLPSCKDLEFDSLAANTII